VLILVDHKISKEAKKYLSRYGELLEIRTQGITYPAISGHPDIFFCQVPGKLIVAPNLPQHYFDQLKAHHIDFITGELPVGLEYPASARYNAVATEKYLIHNFRHTDVMITRTLDNLQPVHVDQGYCRCNLLPLRDDHFITSDRGIYKVLQGLRPSPQGLRPILQGLRPSGIILEGFPHGFFGGCCGAWKEKVFVNGSLKHYREGEKVRFFLDKLGYEVIELADSPLTDCGSILFLDV
jgi:hypothetical protein